MSFHHVRRDVDFNPIYSRKSVAGLFVVVITCRKQLFITKTKTYENEKIFAADVVRAALCHAGVGV